MFIPYNRRLWVFKKAEEFGCFEKIDVIRTRKFNRNKFTTKNGGTSIRVRGDPGGNIWKTWSLVHIRDTHDHDDLNKSSLRVQGPPGSTISRYILVRITSIFSKHPNSSAFLKTHNLRFSIENNVPFLSTTCIFGIL
jgi:hypothetical protein